MQNELIKKLKKGGAKSAYIHIPFCKRKCNYCAFTSFSGLNLIDDYVKKLISEIKYYYKGEALETLYIGGGTPSLMNEKHFEKILSLFNFAPQAEITVEINPDSTDLNLLSSLYKMGVNRLSIGVQSFDDDTLKMIGRLHTSKQAADTVLLAQDVGFSNINIDLIYGLPQNEPLEKVSAVSIFEKSLKKALELDVEHISLYGLKIEEGTVFYKKCPKNLPTDDIQADLYEFSLNYLSPKYEIYEVSNFAKAEKYRSRHNLNYWNEGEYFGFGVSASGFLNNIRFLNTKNFKEYMEDFNSTKDVHELTKKERLEETIFLGFRKTEGVNVKKINEEFGIDFDKEYKHIIDTFSKTGHIEKTENGYRLSVNGTLISNVVLAEFLI